MRSEFLAIILVLIFAGCGDDQLYELNDSNGLHFENSVISNDSLNILDFEYFYNGSGIAVLDADGDGWEDIFICGNQVGCRLFLNEGNLQFVDRTEDWGINLEGRWVMGVNTIDVNRDNKPDLYLCISGHQDSLLRKNVLLINTGEKFVSSADTYGIGSSYFSTQSYELDYDKDGDLDLFIANHGRNDLDHSQIRSAKNDGKSLSNDQLFRNDDSVYTNVTELSGIRFEGYSLSASIIDVNNDSYPDIYVANDYIFSDILYINQRDGTFSNEIKNYFTHTSHFSMGMDAADLNNDGRTDLMVADMLPPDTKRQKLLSGPMNYYRFNLSTDRGYQPQFMRNSLQIARPDGTFSDISFFSGVAMTDWSWSVLFEDMDLDGRKDIYITNGYFKNITDRDFGIYSHQQRGGRFISGQKRQNLESAIDQLDGAKLCNYAFKNTGNLIFKDLSLEWGFRQKTYSHGAIFSDFDQDGDLDLVINNLNEPAFFYESKASENQNSLTVALEGDEHNRMGIGAEVMLETCEGTAQYKIVQKERGYLSSQSGRLLFGIGDCETVRKIRVRWPDGKISIYSDIPANQLLTCKKSESRQNNESFQKVQPGISPDTLYQNPAEIAFNDFNFQALLPQKFSDTGFPLAVGDLDGNGSSDLVVGGPQGVSTKIFLFAASGEKTLIELDAEFADKDIRIADLDNDGYKDVFVASGSYEDFPVSVILKDRIYAQTSPGNFKLMPNLLPDIKANTSTIEIEDFDADGDMDILVGGDYYPRKYPFAEETYLLVNDSIGFRKSTITEADFSHLGHVRTATWSNVNGDRYPDLWLAGDFGYPRLFINDRGQLKETKTILENLRGKWQEIHETDLNGDGSPDYIMTNWGTNVVHRPSLENPVNMYVSDFDRNGTLDFLETRITEAGEVFSMPRDMLLQQLPQSRKLFPNYKSFAESDVSDFELYDLKNAQKLQLNFTETVAIINKGEGFEFMDIPVALQTGPVRHILEMENIHDLPFYLLFGGYYNTEVIYGFQDGFRSGILETNGEDLSFSLPKIQFPKDVSDARTISINGEEYLITSEPNGSILAWKFPKILSKIERGM